MSSQQTRRNPHDPPNPRPPETLPERDIDLDTLEDSVILFAWDDDFEDQDLLNEIFVELIYIKDRLSDESIFRTRVSEIACQVKAGAKAF